MSINVVVLAGKEKMQKENPANTAFPSNFNRLNYIQAVGINTQSLQ